MKDEKIAIEFKNRIPPGKKPDANRLFERFYTSDLSRNASGTGLGLYIVKLLMEKMDGNVKGAVVGDEITITLYFSPEKCFSGFYQDYDVVMVKKWE